MEQTPLLNGINNVVFLKTILCDQLRCKKEDLDFKAIESFNLEHKNLLRINCLWPLTNLTHLNLANNCIRRIENIESLVQLKELNLSFNEISKIENLDTLVKLTKLLLYSNQIRVLENLENLKCLKILNIGANRIEEKLFPFYLNQFKMLRAIVISENPCYEQPNEIDDHLIALMPQLSDLNYKKITEKDRYLASTKYRMKVAGLKKFRLGEIEKPDDFRKSKRKILKNETDFTKMTVDEIFDRLFQNHEILTQLADEGENFRRLNEKFRQKFAEHYRSWEECRNRQRKNLENFVETYKEMEKKSLDTKKNLISNFSSKFTEQTAEDIFNLRMTLLAEECNTEQRLEKVIKDMEEELAEQLNDIFDRVRTVYENIREELTTYAKAMRKNVENCYYKKTQVPYEFQPTARENVFFTNINLEEFFNLFKGHCLAVVAESETAALEEVGNWRKRCSKMYQKNVVRHRKAVTEIMNTIENLTLDKGSKIVKQENILL